MAAHRRNDLESCVLELHSLSHGPEFLSGVMRTLRRLVASPYAIYGLTDLKSGFTCVGLRYPEQIDLTRWVPIFDAHFWQHPLNHAAGKIATGQVVTMPHLVAAAEWARTGNYNEFCRPNGIEHQLMIRLPAATGIMEAIGLGRYDRDFTASECELFERIKAHILVAHRRARLLEEIAPPLPEELGGWQTAHVVLDDDLEARVLGPDSERLFEIFFARPRSSSRKRLPGDVRAWAAGQLRALPETPPAELVREALVDDTRLRLHCWMVPQGNRGFHDVYMQARPVETDQVIRTTSSAEASVGAAFEDIAAQLARVAARWELRPRPREVLALLVRGKSNKEIASQLGCAEVTIEYHVTGLLRRTGASNRASLVTRFWNEH